MRRVFALLVLAMLVLTGCRSVPYDPNEPLSDADRTAIETLVRHQTSEKILSMEREGPKKVLVITGYLRGNSEGSGTRFLLKQTKSGWKIQQRNLWLL